MYLISRQVQDFSVNQECVNFTVGILLKALVL